MYAVYKVTMQEDIGDAKQLLLYLIGDSTCYKLHYEPTININSLLRLLHHDHSA